MPDPIKVYLGGEGKSELGAWGSATRAVPEDSTIVQGVLEAFLCRGVAREQESSGEHRDSAEETSLEELDVASAADQFKIVGAKQWKSIVKYQTGGHRQAEHRNVLGLALAAKEKGAELLVFTRDRDTARTSRAKSKRSKAGVERANHIEAGINEARDRYGASVAIVGGVAIKMIESWMLALRGRHGSESIATPKRKLADILEADHASMEEMVELVLTSDMGSIPSDAKSLTGWWEGLCVAIDTIRKRKKA